MNWKLLSLTMVMGLGMLIWLGSSHAQVLTPLDNCVGDFYITVDQWDSEAVQTGYGSCAMEKGKMLVHLRGNDEAQPTLYVNFNARFVKYEDGSKACRMAVTIHPNLGVTDTIEYLLSNKEAAAWNKFLKSDGCDYALSVLD